MEPQQEEQPTQYDQFTTVFDGIELVCDMDYYPAEGDGDDEPASKEGAGCITISVDGWDITSIVSEHVFDQIEARYLKHLNDQAEQAKTERRIDALEHAA